MTAPKQPPWYVRLARAFREFFNPRDWIPTFPIPRKRKDDGQGR